MCRSCQSPRLAWHDGPMDAQQVAALRALLAPTGWLDRTAVLARVLRRPRTPGGLLVVGHARTTSPGT